MRHVPWAGLLALVAMFVIPFLPAWLFEGPRTVRHYPRRHVCAECNAPWTDGHMCEPEMAEVGEVPALPVHASLERLEPSRELERRPAAWISR